LRSTSYSSAKPYRRLEAQVERLGRIVHAGEIGHEKGVLRLIIPPP
jgi:hypothetical protein